MVILPITFSKLKLKQCFTVYSYKIQMSLATTKYSELVRTLNSRSRQQVVKKLVT